MAPNQSSSWPLSRTICRQPVQTIEQAEADVVEGADLGVLDVGRVVDEAADEDDGEDADGDIDVEGVAPTEGVGEPAAEGGAEDRGDDDSQAVGGHGHGPFGGRKALEQDGLRKRLQRAAARALEHAGQQNDRQATAPLRRRTRRW